MRIACHVITYGSAYQDYYEPMLRQIAEAGYEGVEGISARTAEELVEAAAAASRWGLHLYMVNAPTPQQIIQFNAALGNKSCEIWEGPFHEFGGPDTSREERFQLIAKFFAPFLAEAAEYGMTLHHHIHLGQLVETNEDVDIMLRYMPEMGILLDTGHLAAAGGDMLRVVRDHGDRVRHVHLKDFYQGDPDWDCKQPNFEDNYFVPLGEGNCGLDFAALLRTLDEIGYDGWVSCELDPLPALMKGGRSPRELIQQNREYLRSVGY